MLNERRLDRKTITKSFDSEREATAYWQSIGYYLDGQRVVKNDLEYPATHNGVFQVVTVVETK